MAHEVGGPQSIYSKAIGPPGSGVAIPLGITFSGVMDPLLK